MVTVHQVCEVLTNIMEAKDPFTKDHSEKVAVFSYMLALELGLPARVADLINIAGHLHDIGKFSIPDEILRKPGPLSKEEWEVVKKTSRDRCKLSKKHKALSGEGWCDGDGALSSRKMGRARISLWA